MACKRVWHWADPVDTTYTGPVCFSGDAATDNKTSNSVSQLGMAEAIPAHTILTSINQRQHYSVFDLNTAMYNITRDVLYIFLVVIYISLNL